MNSKSIIAIIGIGRWGKNLIKEFDKLSVVKSCFDVDEESKSWVRKNYKDITLAVSYEEILEDPKIDAVVIATPIETHYKLTKKALEAGKHVFIEKPMTKSSKEAYELDKFARENGLILFTGFTFIYSSIFEKLQELLGKKRFKHIKFEWMKFGFFNVEEIWNYFPHELAILFSLCGERKILDVMPIPAPGALGSLLSNLQSKFSEK